MNGFDRYLEFQFHIAGDFYTALFQTIQQADESNLSRLALGFPGEVEAYKVWSRAGRDHFLQKCTDATPLKRKVLSGEFVL
jgi:hypothetical protein